MINEYEVIGGIFNPGCCRSQKSVNIAVWDSYLIHIEE